MSRQCRQAIHAVLALLVASFASTNAMASSGVLNIASNTDLYENHHGQINFGRR